ncbi:lipopolysaccharide assembly protein LapB [Photobacterium sp. 1_MG-2023]|uniref:tetratricopeptide repeat protein n=1 Tax=Photobacterium sp. 1_MG-2023 TaxID=3062646 RepID=UPI0026E148C0|nr:tetratricopeptide repeat protein [Photobacterium sp. 1_MG-2023]MDO6706381.1 tetratricopeptide repeat protein [Photobacterium sp. 1_MG-2023]
MSQVNQMLNSLSQNKASSDTTELKAARVKPLPKAQWPLWVVMGLIVALIAGSSGWWFGQRSQQTSLATPSAPAEKAQATEKAVIQPPQPSMPKTAAPTAAESVKPSETKQVTVLRTVKPVAIPAPSAPATQPATLTATITPAPPQVAKVAVKPVVKPKEQPSPAANEPFQSQSAPQTVMAEQDDPEAARLTVSEPDDTELVIESVALPPEQLAKIDYDKAMKALAEGDSLKAMDALKSVLEYQPQWTEARQRLSAIYYGRGDVRRAMLTLQQGLVKQPDQPDLRLTMAKLLANESQPEVALDVLSKLPAQPDSEFLALRGALAQQLNQQALALSSYQKLIESEPYDGRWWLGLGIAHDRNQEISKAIQAYTQALKLGQVSGPSQQFIRQRLNALKAQEG